MNTSTVFLSLHPDIQCDASLSGDDLPTRFSGVAYSGGLIPQFGVFGDAAIDLATLQPSERLFMLVNHDPNERAGHGRVWIENNALHVEGQFSRSTEAGRQIAAEFRDGAPWQLSVGLQYQAQRPKEPLLVNGQTLSVKTLFTHAAVREVSFVPMGADPHTFVTAFAADLNPEEPSLSTELESKITALEHQVADLSGQLAAEKTAREAAESALSAVKMSARMSAVKALFADMNKDFSDEAAQPYLAIPDEAFAALAADLRALKPTIDPALTQQVATAGASAPDLLKLNAQLMAQVAGKKE